jgi:hypothetical protein
MKKNCPTSTNEGRQKLAKAKRRIQMTKKWATGVFISLGSVQARNVAVQPGVNEREGSGQRGMQKKREIKALRRRRSTAQEKAALAAELAWKFACGPWQGKRGAVGGARIASCRRGPEVADKELKRPQNARAHDRKCFLAVCGLVAPRDCREASAAPPGSRANARFGMPWVAQKGAIRFSLAIAALIKHDSVMFAGRH